MSDVKCVVCGEPWDYYYLRHDAPAWAWKLFQAGAGCESCEGVPPSGKQMELLHFEDIEFGDLDPQHRLNAHETFAEGKAPKWERPEDEVLWECAGCGVQAVWSAEAPSTAKKSEDSVWLETFIPPKSERAQWYASHRGDVGLEPAHVFDGEFKVCDDCLLSCKDCDAALCDTLEDDATRSFQLDGNYHKSDVLCEECYFKYCSKCQHEECECLQDMIDDVWRTVDSDELSPSRSDLEPWLTKHGKAIFGEDLRREDVIAALFATGYLVVDEAPEQPSIEDW